MTINKILDTIYPLTEEIRTCNFKKQKWQAQRLQLKKMIEEYVTEQKEIKPTGLTIGLNPILLQSMIEEYLLPKEN